MNISRLKDKLLLSTVAISVVLVLFAMLTASWVIGRQYQEQSRTLLTKASRVITDNLDERKNNVLLASRQLATQKNLGSTIWYLAKYGRSGIDREMLLITYQQLARSTFETSRVAKLDKVAIYDHEGNLVAFSLRDDNRHQVGFVRHLAAPLYHLATLHEDEELGRVNLKTANSFARLAPVFGVALPQREDTRFVVIDGMLAIEGRVPIMGEIFNPASGKQETRQLGLVVAVQPIDRAFIAHLSRLTDVSINLFTRQGLALGDIPAYKAPDWKRQERNASAIPQMQFSETMIEGEDFYQSLIPIETDGELVGTIAALYSKQIIQKNTLEMIGTLGLIAIASLMLTLPLAWYLANSIASPLTALSRIFRSVTEHDRNEQLHEDLGRLEKEKDRQDELGDLTRSFLSMNDAINQKIRQINEINASLELKVAERTAALAASERESRTLIEHSPDTIARYDRDCRRIYVNPAFSAMVAGGKEALLGAKPSEVPGGANAAIYEAKILEVFATGIDTHFELKWPGKDNTEVCSHIRLTAEHDPSGRIVSVLGVGRDISELNAYRAELQNKELAKTRFLAAAGHDLRQPLAAANLFIDALKLSKPDAKQSQIIQRLDVAMSTFNGLLDTLLNISKLDAGTIRPRYAPIELSEVFSWLEQNFAPMAGEKAIAFRLRQPARQRLTVRSDLGLLESVLLNLLSNAIKFTAQGGVLVSARRRGNEVLFQVWDTGVGIRSEHLAHIFDEFYQIDNPQRDRTQGLGLGLSIAQRAISLLGGRISCRSRSGHGSVFEFRLPLYTGQMAKPATVDAPDDEEDALEKFMHGKRVVVVEDDSLLAEAMSRSISALGGTATCFSNAEEALCQADIGSADCYIADFMLGGKLSGIEFLNRLRQQLGRPVCAVLVSGDTSPAFMREIASCDWPVLHKPVNITRLIASLRREADRLSPGA